jgi:membrane-bound serine protease (ClpP class)
MKRRLVALIGPLLACFPLFAEAATVNVIELDNKIISPVTQRYIVDAIERSETDGAVALIILIDTPGGLLESTRVIVKRMMNAKVPIAVYVSPSGSRAGSAGAFITLAAHVAAMAPSTNIGAAHPVTMDGGGPARKLIKRVTRAREDSAHKTRGGKPGTIEEEVVEESELSPMSDKILNDTVAWMQAIAKARGRDPALAARLVTESVSLTEKEAVDGKLVDFVAADLQEVLAKLDGRKVDVAGVTVELRTKDAQVARLPMSKRQDFLATITNPNIAYLLMMLGTLGLIFEFTHPGIGFPGIAGLICLLLALYAFQTLPVSYAAIALIGVGLILLVAEIKVTSYGLLAVGGVIALTLGSLMLFESPDANMRVSMHVVIPAVASLAILILFVVQRALADRSGAGRHGLRARRALERRGGAPGGAGTENPGHPGGWLAPPCRPAG